MPDSIPRNTIIVLGMHRSGTSALTRVLNLGGAGLPEDLTEAMPANNEKGFFESREALAIDIRIMNAIGVDWWSTAPIDKKLLESDGLDEYRRQIRQFLATQFKDKSTLLLKDPRMCRVFPIWKKEIRQLDSGLGIVLALRNPRAVASSLFERDGIPHEHGAFLWLRHMLEAERFSRGTARHVAAFDRLLADWREETKAIGESLKRTWQPDWSDAETEISGFLENRLNHFDAKEKKRPMPALVDEAFEVFTALSTGELADKQAKESLDDITARLDDIDGLVGRSLVYTTNQLVKLRLEHNRQQSTNDQIEAMKQDLARQLDRVEKESQRRVDEARRAGQLESDVARLKDYAENLRSVIARREETIESLRGARDQGAAEIEKLKTYSESLRETIARREASLESLRESRTKLDAELNKLRPYAEGLRATIDKRDASIESLRQARDQLNKTIDEHAAEIRKLKAYGEDNRAYALKLDTELGKLRPYAEGLRADRDRIKQALASTRGGLSEQQQRATQLERALGQARRQRDTYLARTREAERSLRSALFDRRPQPVAFNIWARPDLLTPRGGEQCRLDHDIVDPTHWQQLSVMQRRHVGRELVNRELFDIDFYLAQTGAAVSRRAAVGHYLVDGWRQGFEPSPLFNSEYYCRAAFDGDVAEAPGCPLVHYLAIGAAAGLSPNPLFDPEHYRAQLPASMRDHVDPFSHFLTAGWRAFLEPHWAFSTHWYLSRYEDVRAAGVNPLAHYVLHGESENRSPHPFFDPACYRQTLPEGVELLRHFVEYGIGEKRSPHVLIDAHYLARQPAAQSRLDGNWFKALLDNAADARPNHLFSYDHYRLLNSDVAAANTHPFVHWLEFGAAERRRPHVLFDADYYSRRLKLEPEADPLRHYFGKPARDRQGAHPLFDDDYYRRRHPDLQDSQHGLYDHFVRFGGREGRSPGEKFDSRHYQEQIPVPEGYNPLEHYLLIGRQLGISPLPESDEKTSSSGWSYTKGKVSPGENRPAALLVAHVATGNLFGSERSFLDMVQGLHASGLVDVIVTLPQEDATYMAQILPFVTGIYSRRYGWWDESKGIDEGVVNAFKQLIERESQIQVVHVNTTLLREPLIAARSLGRKGAMHVREIIDLDDHLQNRIGADWKTLISAQHELVDYFVCNSLATERLYERDTFVVPNTIDVDAFAAEVASLPDVRDPDILAVGMISSNLGKKGIGDMVELARLHESDPRMKFLLIGPDTPDLQRLVADGLPANVECTGYIEHASEAISRLDVIVSFSHFAESFGRTVLEAMAASRPVVVYDHGALPYLVEHGESGFIIPYLDVAAASEPLRQLASDPLLRERMGRRGREIAYSEYDTHRYVEKMRDAYEVMLGRKEGNRSRLLEHETGAEQVLEARFNRDRNTETLKIAYFQWHFPVPSETFVLNELRGLVSENHDVRVYCRQSPHKDFKPDFPIEWERVDTPEDLAAALKATGRNIVHSHFTYPTVTDMVWPACRIAGARFTFCAHAQDIFKHENDRKNRIGEVVSAPECLAVFVPGRFHFDYLVERGVPAGKIVINPQGIDTALYPDVGHAHVTREHRRIAAVHRFTEKKGLEYAIRAAPRLKQIGVSIDLYGYGDDAEAYRQLAAEVGADNVGIHEGVIDRQGMIDVFEASDMFLAPCIRAGDGDMDGIPTVVMEAMMCGLPVLTTDAASLPELVMHEHTGMVCKQRDADSFADAVERFYALPDTAVERIIDSAAAHVRDRFDVTRLMRMVKRVWQQQRLDIVLVTWNNLPELEEVVTRLYRFTHFPFHLIICDNESEADVREFLQRVHDEHDNVTLIHKGRNSLVGPGTNTAAAHGDSEFVVYVCGKEGFVSQPFWDSAVIHYMTEHPEVGLAGTQCYSPTYLYGRDYPDGIKEWPNFRNQKFAMDNPDRPFAHVQGGFFAIRRSMLDEIGGFSDAVPHSYTDVEFSYYVESCGWQLGEMPHLLALFNKTRPDIVSRMDESVYATHPPMLEQRAWLDAIATRTAYACNVCSNLGDARFDVCDSCGALPADRSLYRRLAESSLTFRRLPAIGIGLGEPLEAFWTKSFQGAYWSHDELAAQGKFDFGDGRIKLVTCRDVSLIREADRADVLAEIRRTLDPVDGEFWVQTEYRLAADDSGLPRLADLEAWLSDAGFEIQSQTRYSSAVISFDSNAILHCKVRNN